MKTNSNDPSQNQKQQIILLQKSELQIKTLKKQLNEKQKMIDINQEKYKMLKDREK